ncbi:hypothetical protein C8035_v004768 [Colletotrichum spinosum]|uniref:Uncharacterized protein n=1 Tax=Colletotrichum spinosum TaxID=1347390 RepID=A0A4R8QHY7_9PEZI|nr:hypothetical protein C8035_v004768 [Colletotrichum spinosum]
MDPDACRNCGHSGKHITFADHRCAIHERDDAERDKMQADAALDRARELCESSLALMKRQMRELEDANAAIEALAQTLAAAEERRERIRRDLGTHGDVCLTARTNLEAAEEMAIAAAGRYFEAGRAVSALEEQEQQRQLLEQQDRNNSEEERSSSRDQQQQQQQQQHRQHQQDGGEETEGRWQRSNERFCKWLRQSEAQRQIMKSSWTKIRVAERLAGEGGADEEQIARRNRVQEWAAARRSDLPPEEEETFHTDGLEEPVAPVDVMPPPPPPARETGDCSGAATAAIADEDGGDGDDDDEGVEDGEAGGEPDEVGAVEAYHGDEGEEGTCHGEPEGRGDEEDEDGQDDDGDDDGGADGGEHGGGECVGAAAEGYAEEVEGAAVSRGADAAAAEVEVSPVCPRVEKTSLERRLVCGWFLWTMSLGR